MRSNKRPYGCQSRCLKSDIYMCARRSQPSHRTVVETKLVLISFGNTRRPQLTSMANSNSARLFMAVLLTFSTTVNASYRALNPLEQLQKRNPYYGGFALPEPSLGCPVGLETCEGSFCCPMGTFCGPTSNGAYCCPTGKDITLPIALLEVTILTNHRCGLL